VIATPATATDAALLARIAEEDAGAFAELYERYRRRIYAFALRRLRDRERAEDAVQETFAAVWRSAGTYRAERGAAGAWLYAVSRNAIVDRFRSRPEESGDPPDVPDEKDGPAQRAERDWVAGRVHSALRTLPEKERAVIELAYWRGLSQSEVADSLGIPLGTVKTRTRSALSRLADLLEEADVA
jgi:RNA polymerase sigma-70 factor (ECF subfamily)